MKKRRRLRPLLPLLCVILAMSFAVMPVFAASAENAAERLTVGVPVDRCPIFYLDDKTGEAVGIGVDLMRRAAEATRPGICTVGTLPIICSNTAWSSPWCCC